MSLSPWFKDELLKVYFHKPSYSPDHFKLQVALTRKIPPANASVSQLDEPPSIFAYSRRGLVLNSTNWGLTTMNEITNLVEILWFESTGDWGVLTGWALVTADASGIGTFVERVAATGKLAQPIRAVTYTQPRLAPGTITLGLRN